MTVVLAAAGYPDAPRTGDIITGAERDGVIHAGTRRNDAGAIVSNGGRVLSPTAIGATLVEARDAAYRLLAGIDLPGGHFRHDIAQRAIDGDLTV